MGSAVVKGREDNDDYLDQQILEREKQAVCYRSIMTGNYKIVSEVFRENNCSLSSFFSLVTLPGCCCCHWLKPFEMRTVLVKEALDYSKALSWNPCQDELPFDKNLDSGQCHCFQRLAPVRIPESTRRIRFTPLQLACYHGFREIVKHILCCTKAPLNHCLDKTPLMMAASSYAKESSPGVVPLLLRHGAKINFHDLHYNTALHYAALSHQPKIVKLLLCRGAHKDSHNYSGQTALWLSVATGGYSCAELLISAGASVNDENLQMGSPLMRAILNTDSQMVRLLLKSPKCDVNAVDQFNKQPLLHSVILAQTFGGSTKEEFEIIDLLLKNGASCDTTDGFHRNALTIAILCNNLDLITVLLQRGCEVNCLADEHFTPCHAAAFVMAHNRLQVLEHLFTYGADLNLRTTNGDSVILYAININSFDNEFEKNNTLATVDWLISHGCEPDIVNLSGETALWKAIVSENENLVNLLISCNVRLSVCCSSRISRLDYAVKTTPLQVAYLTKNTIVADKLLCSGVDMSLERWYWEGPMPSILRENWYEGCKLLQYATNAKSLKLLCRDFIRKVFLTRLPCAVSRLGLPKLLQEYVLCER